MKTTAEDDRRGAYALMRLAQESYQRVTAPINRRRYTDAHREAALVALEEAIANYKAVTESA